MIVVAAIISIFALYKVTATAGQNGREAEVITATAENATDALIKADRDPVSIGTTLPGSSQ